MKLSLGKGREELFSLYFRWVPSVPAGSLVLSRVREPPQPGGQAPVGQPGTGCFPALAPRMRLCLVRASLSPAPTGAEHSTARYRPVRALSPSSAFP